MDLQPTDIRVFNEGAQQEIKSFQHSVKAPATVILLDLMNLSYEQRTFAVQKLRESLDRMHSSGPFYVYLLQQMARCIRFILFQRTTRTNRKVIALHGIKILALYWSRR